MPAATPSVAAVPRRRFALALVIPPPVSTEIDGLRRALGDRQLGRIEPHITVVPPINLHEDQIADALAVAQAAAAGREPLVLRLGPVDTFGPESRVRFLAVEPWAPLQELYRACWTGVLERPERRSYHPHVTVDIDGGVEGEDPAVGLLSAYRADVLVDRLTVLEHVEGDEDVPRRWITYNAYRFGPG
jgi:2'-5' RNA ligase